MFSRTSSNLWTNQSFVSTIGLRNEADIQELEELDIISRPPSFHTLTYFQSSLYATVLEDTISELHILEECNNPIRLTKAMKDMMVLLAQKYAVPQRTDGNELDDIDPKKLNCMEYKLQKLEDDRKYLKDVLFGTYSDLSTSRRSQYLMDQVEEVVDRNNHRQVLAEAEARNRVLRRDLNRQLRHQRNHIKSVFYDTNAVIEKLRTAVEDTDLNTNIRRRYVENFQNARTEQHLQTIRDKETKPLQNIMHYKQKADQEQRIHMEVELLTNIAINETLEKVEHWMNKFDRDMESMDLKIQKKKNQYEDMIMKVKNLEEMIKEHAKEIKSWVTFKDEREAARLQREKMNKAALAVQAWWRGLLVRNQLGPYKVVTRRPPPAAAGKKKK
ncbi:dynein regulatory complex protein 9-like isoform X1 [Epargyreus clarus]|uniref:dynein regulatory complex protein 9-like isoform X1 n=2 Tax=Epargyreus clarus TaxID=520877 RepID=UPI003C2B84A2